MTSLGEVRGRIARETHSWSLLPSLWCFYSGGLQHDFLLLNADLHFCYPSLQAASAKTGSLTQPSTLGLVESRSEPFSFWLRGWNTPWTGHESVTGCVNWPRRISSLQSTWCSCFQSSKTLLSTQQPWYSYIKSYSGGFLSICTNLITLAYREVLPSSVGFQLLFSDTIVMNIICVSWIGLCFSRLKSLQLCLPLCFVSFVYFSPTMQQFYSITGFLILSVTSSPRNLLRSLRLHRNFHVASLCKQEIKGRSAVKYSWMD